MDANLYLLSTLITQQTKPEPRNSSYHRYVSLGRSATHISFTPSSANDPVADVEHSDRPNSGRWPSIVGHFSPTDSLRLFQICASREAERVKPARSLTQTDMPYDRSNQARPIPTIHSMISERVLGAFELSTQTTPSVLLSTLRHLHHDRHVVGPWETINPSGIRLEIWLQPVNLR